MKYPEKFEREHRADPKSQDSNALPGQALSGALRKAQIFE